MASQGVAFWWALRFLFYSVEYALAMWSCLEEDLDADVLYKLMGTVGPHLNSQGQSQYSQPDLWGHLAEDKEGFYVRCHERVRDLTWDQVLEIGGPTVQAHARHVVNRRDGLAAPLPDRLQTGQHTVVAVAPQGAMIETISEFDPVFIPAALYAALHLFDGRPVVEVRAQLEQEHGITVPDETLQYLTDFHVLGAVTAPG